MNHRCGEIQGAGLGLRRPLLDALAAPDDPAPDFLELAPENWLDVGGRFGRSLAAIAERYPLVAHGLSLSLGGPAPLDTGFLARVRAFLDHYGVRRYSEHLSYCGDEQGLLYDLMPIPFTEEAVHHVAARIRQTQDILGRRIAVENISYYATPGQVLSEAEFINAVLREADCELLLDVNNVHVNSVNHGYDACAFIDAMPADRIAWLHMAGHYVEAPDLLVDTHGAEVADPVWTLLDETYNRLGVFPTLLERDFNIPPLATLCHEVAAIRDMQSRHIGDARHVRIG